MSIEFVNRVCPNCKNPNYMMYIGDVSKFKYRCMNCLRYFNDDDFEKEPLQPVWKTECMNTKVDMVEVVRCRDCKWAEVSDNEHTWCDHVDHDFCHSNDWFCADGKRKETNCSEYPNGSQEGR